MFKKITAIFSAYKSFLKLKQKRTIKLPKKTQRKLDLLVKNNFLTLCKTTIYCVDTGEKGYFCYYKSTKKGFLLKGIILILYFFHFTDL